MVEDRVIKFRAVVGYIKC